jgi:hypothetical protein
VPAAMVYLLDLTTFWGGFAFFVVAEVLRWRGASSSIAEEILRPMIEQAAIAPLSSLAILLLLTAPLLDRGLQVELTDSLILYLCCLPYAVVSYCVFRAWRLGRFGSSAVGGVRLGGSARIPSNGAPRARGRTRRRREG